MAAIEGVVCAAARSVDGGRKLLVGIRPERFARLATSGEAGGKSVVSNHPAFVFGHLSLYPAIVLRTCGMEDEAVQADAPAGFARVFGKGAACLDDPEGRKYPPMAEVTGAFFRAFEIGLRELAKLPDTAWDRPNPDAARGGTFTTVGFACVFLLCNHTALHLGQVSAWRRMEGLGPA
jgi:hypothetical protein